MRVEESFVGEAGIRMSWAVVQIEPRVEFEGCRAGGWTKAL
jgi:hypothetical protein